MAVAIHKKGQGTVARMLSGALGAVFSYFLGVEVHKFFTKFMGLPDGAGIALGLAGCVGCALAWAHYTLRSPGSVDYLIETELEMRKVNWPTKKEVLASTGIVIACVVVLGGYIFLNDMLISFLLRKLDIF